MITKMPHDYNIALQSLIVFISLVSVFSLKCDFPNSILINTACVFFYRESLTWLDAVAKCHTIGLHMATFKSNQTIDIVLEAVKNKTGRTKQNYWTGARELGEDGQYCWVDNNSTVEAELWATNEPQNPSTSRCVYLEYKSKRLRSQICQYEMGYMCEEEEPRWYGENSEFLCRCSQGLCDRFGYCIGSLRKCRAGWFGKKCQFYDVARQYLKNFTALRDGDDSTCDPHVTNPLTLELLTPSPFSWLRIVTRKAATPIGFILSLSMAGINQPCPYMKVVSIDNRTFELVCLPGPIYFDVIQFQWPKWMILCSFYISKGRNVALKNAVNKLGVSMTSEEDLVDSLDSKASHCTEMMPGATSQQIQIDFFVPQVINQITIVRKRGIEDFSHMRGLTVETVSEVNRTSFNYTLDSTFDTTRAVSFLTYTNASITAIRISLIGDHTRANRSYIEICEVLAYGDCAPPFYGVECDNNCPDSCPQKMCYINGQCLWPCPKFYTGPQCDEMKVEPQSAQSTSQKYSITRYLTASQLILLAMGSLILAMFLCRILASLLSLKVQAVETSLKKMMEIDAEHGDPLRLSVNDTRNIRLSECRERGLSITHHRHSIKAPPEATGALLQKILSSSPVDNIFVASTSKMSHQSFNIVTPPASPLPPESGV